VYLKSITLKGFKSFPERTRLEFGPGVSVIVGPNGSGKSNVTDAVLWALGEQSPIAVRGHSMQDVIFAGGPGRQAASSAVVELVLDDSEGSLGLGTPEVSIVRRLERTGEGEYRLAGARCRLIDIVEVLSDTGLGKEMHSVISQGGVESIVTSKPRDRRLLIEEAAGLGKHRKRRRRAQLKLARTQENLDRALDVEREARSRLRPLKRQAEAAELHARLERQTLEARWELSGDELRGRLEEQQDAHVAAAQVRERRQGVESELQAVAARRQAVEETLATRGASREELSRRCLLAQSAAERIGDRARAVQAVAEALEIRLQRDRQLLDGAHAGAAAQSSNEEAEQRIAALETSLAALDRDRERELAGQLAELDQRLASAARATSERASAQLRDAERALEAARREGARVGAELSAVDQFLRSQAPFPGAGAALADELEVDPGYELAVAAALDGRLRAALVGDRSAAAALIDRAGGNGARALVFGTATARAEQAAPPQGTAPAPGARPLAEHVRGPVHAVALTRHLLRETWVVESLEEVAESFAGVAVTRGGRVWSSLTRELRQAPAAGEERLLAERNRREQLVRAAKVAARTELTARAALERAAAGAAEADAARERVIAAHRSAVRERDEASDEERRVAALIERRRAAPDDSATGARRLQLSAELSAERVALAQRERERAEKRTRIQRLEHAVARAQALIPAVRDVIESLDDTAEAIGKPRATFEAALAADREAGEHVAGELRACAQQEVGLQAQLHHENEALTDAEVRLQRARDSAAEAEREVRELATRLELEARPAAEPLDDEQRAGLQARLQRLARRREQLGPINPLAQDEYTGAREHAEDLERQRADMEAALRELEKLIADTDRQIREAFERTFEAAARNFEQVAAQLFPGGRGRLRLVAERERTPRMLGGETTAAQEESPIEGTADADGSEDDGAEDLLGVEIEITPGGKQMKGLSLLSGGEKSLTALAFLFAVFLARPCPFYILDEVEAALDDLNIDRFLALLRGYSRRAQFIVVTHQKRTMEAADFLYGVSMAADGISKVISRRLEPVEEAEEEAA